MALSTIPTRALSEQGINFRNLIINGDMSIAQRGAGPSGTFAGSGFSEGPDRYEHILIGLGTWQSSQSTDVPSGQGFSSSFRMNCISANASAASNDNIYIRQKIEAQNLQHLKYGTSSAESLTLSFWVKSTKTGTFVVWLYQDDDTRSVAKSYTVNSSNTWEKKTITFDGDTTGIIDNDNGSGIRVNFFLGAGTDWTSGTLATSWEADTKANRAVGQVNCADSTSNNWYITGVQLEVGTSASDFEFLPFDVNLQRCQRYFEILSIKQASQENEIMNMISFNASQIYGTYQFRTEKRNDPSLVVDNGTNYFRYYRQGGNENFSSIGLDNSSLHQASLYGTGLSLTSGEGGFVRWVNNASTNDKVAFDSEL